jgi:hypothetical protein
MNVRAISLLLALAGALAAPAIHAADLLVPAYFYPAGKKKSNHWVALAATAGQANTIAVLNPASGPGTFVDPNYTAAVSQFQLAGGTVIGYVSTRYAARPLNEVTADINTYIAQYPVQGFFIDEMTNDAGSANVQFYQSVYSYIKALNPQYMVVGNPGTNTAEVYASLPLADRLVVFENSISAYGAYAPAAWQANYAASRFVHIVYGASKRQMADTVTRAASRGAGSLFVTNDVLVNPYDSLPNYWSEEVRRAANAD